jgi:hypothetical protein
MATKSAAFHIPKQFDLAGLTWKVEELDVIPGCMGACSNSDSKIVLLKSLSPEVKLQTFLHELNHAILFSMGKTADQHDEQFVDGHANFFLQFLKTAK